MQTELEHSVPRGPSGGLGCVMRPGAGGVRGELSRQASEVASAVGSAQAAAELWEHKRISAPQVRVLIANMLEQAVISYGAVAALRIRDTADNRARRALLTEIGAACQLLVDAKYDAEQGERVHRSALKRSLGRLHKLSDNPTTQSLGP